MKWHTNATKLLIYDKLVVRKLNHKLSNTIEYKYSFNGNRVKRGVYLLGIRDDIIVYRLYNFNHGVRCVSKSIGNGQYVHTVWSHSRYTAIEHMITSSSTIPQQFLEKYK